MPNPGQANNPDGVNAYSGPLGEKEPAYGEVERAQQLDRAIPVGSPDPNSIPKRAQRKGSSRGVGATPDPTATLHPQAPAMATAQSQQQQFWQTVLADPEASPLTRQYAEQALGQ